MNSRECTNCSATLVDGARFCRSCGHRVTRSCPDCGSEVKPGNSFCTSCGAVLAAAGAEDPPAAPPEHQARSGTFRRIALVAGAFALFAAGAGLTALVIKDSGESEQVVLERYDYRQGDGFTPNLDSDIDAARRAASRVGGAQGRDLIGDPRSSAVTSSLSGQVVTGTDPTVYGGSRDTRVCNTEGLVSFFEATENADRAEAFAGAAGVEPADIGDFVGGLTAVRLAFDTRVTNHGFEDGEAVPFQSVLQSGTGVLVDSGGVPRVKCNGGGPLLGASALDEGEDPDEAQDLDERAQNPDAVWNSFDPNEVTSVRPGADAPDAFTVVDLENEDGLLERRVGSDGASLKDTGTGDVKVTLSWASISDIDVHVFEPDGYELWYGDTGPSNTDGQLDVDANVSCEEDGSLENIFWPLGEAPTGDYTVEVHGYEVDGCGSGDYTLTIKVAGQATQVYTGTVGEDEIDTYEFDSNGLGDILATPTEEETAGTWLALGDSYSSGEGIPGAKGFCQRADHEGTEATAWAVGAYEDVAPGLSLSEISFVPCTGAINDDVADQLAQAQRNTGKSTFEIASMSFGGNNIRFKDILLDCLDLPRGASLVPSTSPGLSWLDFAASPGCDISRDELDRRTDMLVENADIDANEYKGSTTLPQVYDLVASKMEPGADVFVLGYPHLIEESGRWPTWQRAADWCQGIRGGDVALLRGATGYLNQQIAQAVEDADEEHRAEGVRFHFIDISRDPYESGDDPDDRHGLCSDEPWLNGITLNGSQGLTKLPNRSFHPTQTGHTKTAETLSAFIQDEEIKIDE